MFDLLLFCVFAGVFNGAFIYLFFCETFWSVCFEFFDVLLEGS